MTLRSEKSAYDQELKRALTLTDLLVYGLVFIAPIAPVSVYGIVYNASQGMVPLTYLTGLVAMIFTALSYASMSRVFPVAGSVYTYAGMTLGESAGFLAGWAMLLDYILIPTLTYVVCAIAAHAAFPWLPERACICTLVAINTAVNYTGIKAAIRWSFVLLIVQLLILAVFMVLASMGVARGALHAHLALAPLFDPARVTGHLIFGALSLAALSFLGFDAISTLSEEAADGPAAIAKATILSLCLSAVLFIAQTYLASLFTLGRTRFPPGIATNEAFYDIAALVGGNWLRLCFTVPGVLVSGAAAALSALTATARLLYGMARDGNLPRTLAHVHERRKVPERALLLIAGVTLVLSLVLTQKLELLASTVSFGALIGFLLLHASVIAHFRSSPARRPLRHVVSPAIGLAIVAYVLWNAEPDAKIVGACWMGLGVFLMVLIRHLRTRALTSPSPRSGQG